MLSSSGRAERTASFTHTVALKPKTRHNLSYMTYVTKIKHDICLRSCRQYYIDTVHLPALVQSDEAEEEEELQTVQLR